jgi:hypothetical protein
MDTSVKVSAATSALALLRIFSEDISIVPAEKVVTDTINAKFAKRPVYTKRIFARPRIDVQRPADLQYRGTR